MKKNDRIIVLENEILRLNGIVRVLKQEQRKLQQSINGIYSDAVKYPQLAIPARQLERLVELVK